MITLFLDFNKYLSSESIIQHICHEGLLQPKQKGEKRRLSVPQSYLIYKSLFALGRSVCLSTQCWDRLVISDCTHLGKCNITSKLPPITTGLVFFFYLLLPSLHDFTIQYRLIVMPQDYCSNSNHILNIHLMEYFRLTVVHFTRLTTSKSFRCTLTQADNLAPASLCYLHILGIMSGSIIPRRISDPK